MTGGEDALLDALQRERARKHIQRHVVALTEPHQKSRAALLERLAHEGVV
jgi:hypothetical protein